MQMVHRDERQPPRPGERLRGGDADEQRADQPRPCRHGHRFDARQVGACLRERRGDDGDDELEVATTRDLGNDAAEAGVQIGLRGDDVGEDLAVAGDECGRGLVARRLEAEDHTRASLHMMSASSRLSV